MDRLIEATRRAEQEHFWFRGFRAFVRPLVAEATGRLASPRILDCGCGTGANMVMLDEHGTAYGFDLTLRGVEFAREYGVRRVVQASITAIPFPSTSFDLVTAFDVLYTLQEEDETRALLEMYRVLKPGGALLVNVAALDMLRGSHSVFGAEVRRSTRKRLRRIIESAGLRIERLTYTNFSLFPLMLAVRTTQRIVGLTAPEEVAADIVVPPKPVNTLLSGLLAVEARLLRHVDMPLGSSLLCLARKPVT